MSRRPRSPELSPLERFLDRISPALIVICCLGVFWALVGTVVNLQVSPRDRAEIIEMTNPAAAETSPAPSAVPASPSHTKGPTQ